MMIGTLEYLWLDGIDDGVLFGYCFSRFGRHGGLLVGWMTG